MYTIVSIAGEPNRPDVMRFEVDSEADIENLPQCAPDSIAYTAGYKRIWHCANDGTWVEIE